MADQIELEGAEVPAELAPKKRGRPPGSKTRADAPSKQASAPAAPLARDAVSAAWLGVWALLRLLTWALGRFFVRPGETAELGPLMPEEADEDAPSLVALFNASPVLVRVLTFVGAPVVILQRIREKLTIKGTPTPKPAPAPATAKPTPAGEAPVKAA